MLAGQLFLSSSIMQYHSFTLCRALQPAVSQHSHSPLSIANSLLIRIKLWTTMERLSLAVRFSYSYLTFLALLNIFPVPVPFWKARFGAECVSAVVQGTLTSRAPKYSIILDLDRKVRDMELPSYAQGPPPQGLGLALTMSHFMPTNYRELSGSLSLFLLSYVHGFFLALLYIHRCFFAHAISSNPLDPIKSQYAPSFLAGYRSACTIIGSVKQQFTMFPEQIARFWVLWTHAFSATVSGCSYFITLHG